MPAPGWELLYGKTCVTAPFGGESTKMRDCTAEDIVALVKTVIRRGSRQPGQADHDGPGSLEGGCEHWKKAIHRTCRCRLRGLEHHRLCYPGGSEWHLGGYVHQHRVRQAALWTRMQESGVWNLFGL